MRASAFVGRVGGLAVALGIGSGIAVSGIGVAWAAPEDSVSSASGAESSRQTTSTRPNSGRTADRQRGARPSRTVGAAEPTKQGQFDTAAPEGPLAARTGRGEGVYPKLPQAELPFEGSGATASDSVVLTAVDPSEVSDQPLSPMGVADRSTANVAAPATVVTGLAAAALAAGDIATADEMGRAAEPAPPVMVPAPQPSAATPGSVNSLLTLFSGSDSGAPVESTVSWAILAAARRDLRKPSSAQISPTAVVATGPVPDTDPDSAQARVAVTAPTTVGNEVQAIEPSAAATADNPIAAIVEQIGSFISGVVTAITQVINQVVQAVTQVVTSIVNIVIPGFGNAPPAVATPTVGQPDEVGGVVAGSVSAGDPDGDALIFSAPATTGKGAVAIDSATGEFTYTPTDAARHGAAALTATSADRTDSFAVTVTDERGAASAVTVTVAISPVNTAPVAGTSSVGAPDSSTGVVIGAVSASDADGDTVSFSGSGDTAKGSVVVNPDGSFTYTPTAAARHGAASEAAVAADLADGFMVTLADGHGGTATVAVSVVIGPANTAPVAGTPLVGAPDSSTGVVSGSVSANDADGDAVSFSGSGDTAKGAVVVNPDGSFAYTPTAVARHAAASDGATAGDLSDSFWVAVADGHGASVQVPVAVAVSPSNTAPMAEIASISLPDPGTGVVTGLMTAADADGDVITYSLPVSTDKGDISFGSDGSFSYTPTAQARHAAARDGATDADTTDTFTVTFTDGHGGSVEVPVSVSIIPVNSAPEVFTAIADAPDESTGAVSGSVSAGDADGDTLIFSGTGDTAKGRVVINPDGSFTYTPTATARHDAARDGAGLMDPSELFDVFMVAISDDHGGSVEATVIVGISPANMAPVAGDVTTGEAEESIGAVTGSVTASDPDGDSVTFSGSVLTSKGTVVVSPSGEFTYTPSPEARRAAYLQQADSGSDTFFVTAVDGFGGSVEIPVQVLISPAVTYFLTGDLKRDPVTGNIALRTAFAGNFQDPVTGDVGYLNWLVATANRGASHAFPADVDSWETLFLTGANFVGDTYSASIELPTNSVLRNPANGAVAIRTIFPEADLPGMTWLAATTSSGARHLSAANVEGWDVLFVPGAAPTITGYSTQDPEQNGAVRGHVTATGADGDSLSYSAPASTGKGYIAIDGASGAFVYVPIASARQTAAQPDADSAATADTFTVTVSDGYFASEVDVSVSIAPAAELQTGDIRVQPGGTWSAIYAPGVTVSHQWVGVVPDNGGRWFTDAEVADWLDVAPPLGTETSGTGTYQPGDIRVPPGSMAGEVAYFAVRTGGGLADSGYTWMVCSVGNACHASTDDQTIAGNPAAPVGQWVDLKHPLELEPDWVSAM